MSPCVWGWVWLFWHERSGNELAELERNIEYEVDESTMADLLAISNIWWWLIIQLSWHLAAVQAPQTGGPLGLCGPHQRPLLSTWGGPTRSHVSRHDVSYKRCQRH